MIWIVVITAILAIGSILYYHHQFEQHKKQSRKELLRVANHYKSKLLEESLHRCLAQMDKTNDFYRDEDEANRELTSCLNLLGHNAQYHYPLGNRRVVDIFVDNVIIEGKLDLSQSEADRLVGQISDYLNLPYHIYIVLYGKINQSERDRVSMLIKQYPSKIDVVYLMNAKRARKLTAPVSLEYK